MISSIIVLLLIAKSTCVAQECKSSLMTEAFAQFRAFRNENKADANLKWSDTQLKDTVKGGFKITCQIRPIEKTTLISTEAVITDADVSDVEAAFVDHYDLDEDSKDYKMVEKKENSAIHYSRYAVPIPFVADRDILLETTVEEVSDGRFVFSRDTVHADKPETRKIVRMKYWNGAFLQQDGNDVKLTSFEYANAGHTLLNGFDAASSIDELEMVIQKMKK